MTAENAARTIRSDPTMVQAGLQCCLSREPDLGSGRNSFFLAVNVYHVDRDS
jgi:hypothetical protein